MGETPNNGLSILLTSFCRLGDWKDIRSKSGTGRGKPKPKGGDVEMRAR